METTNWRLLSGDLLIGDYFLEFMKILGNLLDCSGWTHILAQSGVAGSGTAESFLNASNVKKTRYAHHVTASCLWILQQESYKDFCKQSNDTDTDFVSWCEAKMQESSHFFFWHLIEKCFSSHSFDL